MQPPRINPYQSKPVPWSDLHRIAELRLDTKRAIDYLVDVYHFGPESTWTYPLFFRGVNGTRIEVDEVALDCFLPIGAQFRPLLNVFEASLVLMINADISLRIKWDLSKLSKTSFSDMDMSVYEITSPFCRKSFSTYRAKQRPQKGFKDFPLRQAIWQHDVPEYATYSYGPYPATSCLFEKLYHSQALHFLIDLGPQNHECTFDSDNDLCASDMDDSDDDEPAPKAKAKAKAKATARAPKAKAKATARSSR